MSLAALLARAAGRPARLLLAGGDRALLEEAKARLRSAGVSDAELVGEGGVRPDGHARLNSVALLLRSREPDRVRDGIDALDLATDPVRFAAGLLALGDVDAVVAGPGVSCQAMTEAVAWTLGPPLDRGPVRSATWVLIEGNLVALADCVFLGEPPPAAQARLARAVARTHGHLTDEPARVAFLTGPPQRETDDSAEEAVELLRAMDAGITAEADPAARFRARPNVLIFPGGTAGHLAARTIRSLAGALLLGPLLLGPSGTVAGVAEDANVDELVGTAALAVLASGTAAI